MTNLEEWRPVLGFESYYEVSSEGRVRSLDRLIEYSDGRHRPAKGALLSPTLSSGYPAYSIRGRKMRIMVLMLEAFVGPRPPGQLARHLDDDKTNNVLSNLAWGTPRQNVLDWKQRITHCPAGHPYDEKNTYYRARGSKDCVACRNDKRRK